MARGKKKTFTARSKTSNKRKRSDSNGEETAVDDSQYRPADKLAIPAKLPKYLPYFYNFIEHRGNDVLKDDCHWDLEEHKVIAEHHWPLFAETGKPKAPKESKPKAPKEPKPLPPVADYDEDIDEGLEDKMIPLSVSAIEQCEADMAEEAVEDVPSKPSKAKKGQGDIRKHFKSVRDRVRDLAREERPLDMQTAKELLDQLREIENMVQG